MNDTPESINKWLIQQEGYDVINTSKPKYRLVWSEDLFETRKSNFVDFDSTGKIFIRATNEIRKAPKYTNIKERWIFEKFYPYAKPDVIESDDYEALYVFEDEHGNFLVPTLKVMEVLLYGVRNPKTTKWIERVSQMKEAEDKQLDKDIADIDIDPATLAYGVGSRISMADGFKIRPTPNK